MLNDSELNMLIDWIWEQNESFLELINQSEKTGVECGYTIYRKVPEISRPPSRITQESVLGWLEKIKQQEEKTRSEGYFLTSHSEGTESEIDLPECPVQAEAVGTVHTHPSGHFEFSAQDYISAINRGHQIHCLLSSMLADEIISGTYEDFIRNKASFTREQRAPYIKCENLSLDILGSRAEAGSIMSGNNYDDFSQMGFEPSLAYWKIREPLLRAAYYNDRLKAEELKGEPEGYNKATQDFHKLALELGFLESCQVPESKLTRWDTWLLFNPMA